VRPVSFRARFTRPSPPLSTGVVITGIEFTNVCSITLRPEYHGVLVVELSSWLRNTLHKQLVIPLLSQKQALVFPEQEHV